MLYHGFDHTYQILDHDVLIQMVSNPPASAELQSSTLRPLLFSIYMYTVYINDIPDVCPDLNAQMYAADAVTFTHDNDAKTIATDLTNALTKVQHWLSQTSHA